MKRHANENNSLAIFVLLIVGVLNCEAVYPQTIHTSGFHAN